MVFAQLRLKLRLDSLLGPPFLVHSGLGEVGVGEVHNSFLRQQSSRVRELGWDKCPIG